MKYALTIDHETRHILSATFAKYAVEGMPIVDTLPDGNISDYLYENGQYVYSPNTLDVEQTPAQLREEAYNTERVVEFDSQMLTVTEACQLWQYYAAEGSEKSTELQTLIATAKAEIRQKYPDISQ